jgi:SPP1 gp7 family putative phage head morphogenesis protein
MGRKTKADPTGQATNRNKAEKALIDRLRIAQKDSLALFAGIPFTTKNKPVIKNELASNQLVYEYELSSQQLSQLSNEFTKILIDSFDVAAADVPAGWFYNVFINAPYQEATAEDIRDINNIVSQAEIQGFIQGSIIPRQLELLPVINSPIYRRELQKEFVKNYDLVKTMSQNTAAQVFERVRSGMESGSAPTKIATDIRKRFSVAKSNSERIARTEVNAAYNNAKLSMADVATDQLDIQIGSMHISALSSTTRVDHARRHGLTYTVADQLRWWNTTPNRINCLCTVRHVVINPKTGKPFNIELQQDTRKEGKEFFEDI